MMVAAGSPGGQVGAANAQLSLSQRGALYSTDQGNEARACVESRTNAGEKARRSLLLHYSRQRQPQSRTQ